MTTYILMTKLSPVSTRQLGSVEAVGMEIGRRVREHCPGVRWKAHYATLGPYDYLDIFEAQNEAEASEVALLTSTVGHATTETWTAMPYEKFVEVAQSAAKG